MICWVGQFMISGGQLKQGSLSLCLEVSRSLVVDHYEYLWWSPKRSVFEMCVEQSQLICCLWVVAENRQLVANHSHSQKDSATQTERETDSTLNYHLNSFNPRHWKRYSFRFSKKTIKPNLIIMPNIFDHL